MESLSAGHLLEHVPSLRTVRKLRVLVVDDSVVARRFVTRILAGDPAFEVVGFAADGVSAMAQELSLRPDVITMDVEMPLLDGLATVKALRARGSKAIIVMCSSLTTRGASTTIETLLAGANEYVTKHADGGHSNASDDLSATLLPAIRQFFPSLAVAGAEQRISSAGPVGAAFLSGASPGRKALVPPEHREIVAMAISTGGPTALLDLLPRLPAHFPVPIVIVQHMPPVFTAQLAARLNAECALEVREATEGMPILPGRVVLAPGDFHMRLRRSANDVVVTLDRTEKENSCRPAADVLFRSVAEVFGGRALAMVLTGMGQDGLRGAMDLRQRGAYVLVQDRASSVVWGMPGAVAEAGLADGIVGLAQMAEEMQMQVPKR